NYSDFKVAVVKTFVEHITLEIAFVATDGGWRSGIGRLQEPTLGSLKNGDPTFLAGLSITF
ncbi:MAG: hypothetical protein AB7R69_02745, partial [Candidatus Babeliales bacterium]